MTALTQTIDFKRARYKEVCDELKKVMELRKEAEAKEKELKKLLLEQAGGEERMEFGIKISLRERKGTYEMQEVFAEMGISLEEGEQYRKEGSNYWDIRSY